MNIHIVEHESASSFLDSCQNWLSQYEILNHGVLSLADILTPQHPIYHPPFLFIHVTVNGKIAGSCIYAEPDGLVLSNCVPDSLLALFDYLRTRIDMPSRIFGPEIPALQLAKLFGDLRNAPYHIHSTWRIHRLDQPIRGNVSIPGKVRMGEEQDCDLVREWGENYNEERPANVDIQQFLLKKLRDNQLYFWIDERQRSLATISGANCSGPRISAVYTPPTFRTSGYATALVHELSNIFIGSGSPYVTLNTQAGDPVENIYRQLGYYAVGEKVSIVFGDR